MSTPSHPAALELSAGTHALCTCGLIKNGPFCDGSHQGSGKTPPHPQARRPKNYLPLQLRRHGQQPLLRRQPRQSQCCSSSGSKAALVEGLGLSETMSPTETCDVLVIAASNGQNLQLAERFAAAAREQGQRAAVLDLTAIGLPLFTPRAQAAGTPPALVDLEAQLSAAPRWVICAPEYNGSIPPVLTSAIAWLSVQGDDFRALFNGRPVVIATHSGGGGHAVLTALRLQLAHLGAHVVGRQLVSNKTQSAKDDSIADLISRLHHLCTPQP